jgi:hypothetical protein
MTSLFVLQACIIKINDLNKISQLKSIWLDITFVTLSVLEWLICHCSSQ